jgi:Holliday junction resolvasome RuvABC endonuclease subunit
MELEQTIVGIDPSFTRTGIAILTKDKKIVFHTLSEQIGKKDFIHTYDSAYSLAIQLKDYLKDFKPFKAVMEYAPPISSMSPALYCLDSLYHFVLQDSLVQLYHPMTLATIIGKGKARTKADSVLKGLSIIEDLQKNGWVMTQKRKPCHDCFEALIYVDYYLKNGGTLCQKKKVGNK